MIDTTDFKSGLVLLIDNGLFEIMDYQHVKPGKGGAFVVTKLKNIRTGAIISNTFNAGTKFEVAEVEKNEMNYLYDEGDKAIFMNNETYDQLEINKESISDKLQYLTIGNNCKVRTYKGEVIGIEIPDKVTLTVTSTPPGEKGNSKTNTLKEATLETGIKVSVPMFINNGDRVVINTETGKYDTRSKD